MNAGWHRGDAARFTVNTGSKVRTYTVTLGEIIPVAKLDKPQRSMLDGRGGNWWMVYPVGTGTTPGLAAHSTELRRS